MRDFAYDIIPDIHGDHDRLTATLSQLGYVQRSGTWRAPEGRRAAFLGDFIDVGPENLKVLAAVRAMIEAEEAVAIMGNHELNAILFHTPGEDFYRTGTGYMRGHSPRNLRQHASFLKEAPVGSSAAAEARAFFLDLPVCLDLGGLRITHAAWSDTQVAALHAHRPSGRLAEDDLQAVALEDWDNAFVAAVLSTTKGPEIALPDGGQFIDHKGEPRGSVRVSWWLPEARSWEDVSASVPDPSDLPRGDVPSELLPPIDPGPHPVAFGHYKRRGEIAIEAPQALCLDYPDQPVAYRWDGEQVFDMEKILRVAA